MPTPPQASAVAPVFRPPETRYALSGDVNIACQVVGEGPVDLVFVMGWVSHLDCFWTSPLFSRFLLRLASFTRLILFDKRGTGLSDRVAELPTLEQRMDDVRAVMEAVGSSRAVLLGVSEGGPMCSLFAATYPEKTLALVTIGTYAKRIWAPDYPWAPTPEERERFLTVIRDQWGGPVGIEDRAPTLAADPEFRAWWSTYLRMGASPGAALQLTRMNAEIDVRQVLPTIRVPTLVLHRVDDRCLRVEEGRYFAARIPGARLVELPGSDHLPFVGDQDAMLDEIEAFVTGGTPAAMTDTLLATVLAFDVCGEGGEGVEGGSTAFEGLARRDVAWFRGTAAGGEQGSCMAAFDGPARAIRCAMALSVAAQRFGLESRFGLHTGECSLAGGKLGGMAPEIARAVAACARPGEILVSRTVRDLVAGSGLQFAEAGAYPLPDAAGDGVLFRVTGEGRAGHAVAGDA
ncbi:MAG: alpha/beta fold hydrolase [Vicinamibacteraceae bacterium]|nr:alpha/beta fold hydrolase [Vicinamibacteraceae bacterium]